MGHVPSPLIHLKVERWAAGTCQGVHAAFRSNFKFQADVQRCSENGLGWVSPVYRFGFKQRTWYGFRNQLAARPDVVARMGEWQDGRFEIIRALVAALSKWGHGCAHMAHRGKFVQHPCQFRSTQCNVEQKHWGIPARVISISRFP